MYSHLVHALTIQFNNQFYKHGKPPLDFGHMMVDGVINQTYVDYYHDYVALEMRPLLDGRILINIQYLIQS